MRRGLVYTILGTLGLVIAASCCKPDDPIEPDITHILNIHSNVPDAFFQSWKGGTLDMQQKAGRLVKLCRDF